MSEQDKSGTDGNEPREIAIVGGGDEVSLTVFGGMVWMTVRNDHGGPDDIIRVSPESVPALIRMLRVAAKAARQAGQA